VQLTKPFAGMRIVDLPRSFGHLDKAYTGREKEVTAIEKSDVAGIVRIARAQEGKSQ
jgi:hypothetical protein